MMQGLSPGTNSTSAAILLAGIEAIERLEVEKGEIAEAIREEKSRLKGQGFDLKVVNQMLRERKMTLPERLEHQALCETYRAALGMLGGTPLGEIARKRMSGEDDETQTDIEGDKEQAEALAKEGLEEARERGRQAAREGRKVIENPYVAGDPRRALWDEGWCQESGTDGMEIPKSWQRTKKPKKDDEGKGGGA